MPSGDAGYASVIDRLEQAATFGIHPSLDGIRSLVAALGCPERECRCIQVTGTNGKTSVTRMIGAILSAHGYRTGVYTSPHLVSYTERIQIDGEPLSAREFTHAVEGVFRAAASLGGTFTEFEILTAAALLAFRDAGVEFAVLEVGMGGRWDATSVVEPAVAVITGVALDHTDRLGGTREEIAADKAHIIRPGSVPIIGPGCEGVENVFRARAAEMGHPRIMRVGLDDEADTRWRVVRRPRTPGGALTLDILGLREYRVSLHAPSYQAPNVATAMMAAGAALWNVLDPAAVELALRGMTFPGRFEVLRNAPPLVLDGAHNPDAAEVLAATIAETFPTALPVIVLGILADKDVEGIVHALSGAARAFVTTENGSPRCLPAAELAGVVERITGHTALAQPSLAEALRAADTLAGSAGVVVTGSLYTVGAVKALRGDA